MKKRFKECKSSALLNSWYYFIQLLKAQTTRQIHLNFTRSIFIAPYLREKPYKPLLQHPEEQRSREIKRGELKTSDYVGKSAKERSDCENGRSSCCEDGEFTVSSNFYKSLSLFLSSLLPFLPLVPLKRNPICPGVDPLWSALVSTVWVNTNDTTFRGKKIRRARWLICHRELSAKRFVTGAGKFKLVPCPETQAVVVSRERERPHTPFHASFEAKKVGLNGMCRLRRRTQRGLNVWWKRTDDGKGNG